jgi:hypothetical protein
MTKEEILEQCGFPASYFKDIESMPSLGATPLTPALKAMDIFAEQTAISFAEFTANEYVYEPDVERWVHYFYADFPYKAPEKFTTKELYSKFIEQKTKE